MARNPVRDVEDIDASGELGFGLEQTPRPHRHFVLGVSGGQNQENVKRELLVDIAADEVLLVLTPACDLQRNGAPRVLLLVGKTKPLKVKDWSYANDARTSSIKIDGQDRWIKWNVKHVDTVSPANPGFEW